jgi:erythronate-4-phosphate dehydrogenase
LNDPPRARNEGGEQFVTLSAILEQSDIITLHVPLIHSGIDKTFRMVDATFLGKMKNGSFLINTSRGKVVDEKALKEALRSRHANGVILDVWDNEPSLDVDLLSMTCIGTPHIAGYSQDGKANGTSAAVQSLSRYFNLNLHEWYPENIPKPANPEITIHCEHKDTETVIGDAVLLSYPIAEDHQRLVDSPDQFEALRGNYPVRREFQAYTVELISGNDRMINALKKIGFNFKT